MASAPIHPDVRRICRRWAGSSSAFPRLVWAIVIAEGGTLEHLLKAVRCSMPGVQTTDEAIEVTCRTVAHHAVDFLLTGNPTGFVSYLGAKWAPLGVSNDPTNLNANWIPNVLRTL